MTGPKLCPRHTAFALGFCPICKMEAEKEAVLVPRLAVIVERLETVRASMIRDHGRLTPQAILDVQGVLNDLKAALAAQP